ncbi:hypothetical protein JHK85_050928 [Glycine max]|nr:hypothetical protein JHK85_050928 [Glycine max]
MVGNISGSLETSTTDPVYPANLIEDQQNLKDTLIAYRTPAEAASRIHAAFREHSLKLRTKAHGITPSAKPDPTSMAYFPSKLRRQRLALLSHSKYE